MRYVGVERVAAVVTIAALVSVPVDAKPKLGGAFPFQASKKQVELRYPPLPQSTLDRINGKGSKSVATVRPDTAIARDWALNFIGFFEVFTSTLKPRKAGIEACSNEVVVAVIDTGIDYTHPELANSVWINWGEAGPWEPPASLKNLTTCRDKSCNGIDDDGNGFVDDIAGWDFVHDVPLPYDTHGHGTHIAGIIAGAAANGSSVGVCPNVTIMPLKYYDNSGAGYNNLANTVRAIQYAVRNGAHIINYSGGGADPAASERAAVEEANRRGVLFVAAAGNDGHDNRFAPYYPASYGVENIVSVASVNREGKLLPSSNYGRTVQLAAPGLGILSTLPEGKFGTMSGTSQATAFVTGAAALLLSQVKGRPELDPRVAKRWLLESARPLKGDHKQQLVSHGALWLPGALELEARELSLPIKTPSTRDFAARPKGAGVAADLR
jgi:subtilisin family serine protease